MLRVDIKLNHANTLHTNFAQEVKWATIGSCSMSVVSVHLSASRPSLLQGCSLTLPPASCLVPFLEDCNAIIFMTPISCFDKNLEENHRVNYVVDSLLLWQAICSSKLLSKVQFILFLNKCDLLVHKLKRGATKVQDYFPDFGNQINDVKTVAACQLLLL
jgi:hypothetical protein